MTSFVAREELKLLVVGDVGCGKTNFIKKFLSRYSTFLEIHRDTDDIYQSHIPDSSITVPLSNIKVKFTCNTIRLHNLNDVTLLSNREFYEKVDVIFYCYASDKPETFRNLERKWIPQLKSEAQYSFLVANLSSPQSGLDHKQQQLVSDEKARKLKKRHRLRCYVKYRSDYRKLFTIFEYFLNQALSRLYFQKFEQ